MNNMQTITKCLKKHKLTPEQFCNYQRSMPAEKKRMHEAITELFYQHNFSLTAICRVLKADGHELKYSKAVKMYHGIGIDLMPTQYSLKEMETLRKMCKTHSYEQIAKKLGRTKAAIKEVLTRKKLNARVMRPDYYLGTRKSLKS